MVRRVRAPRRFQGGVAALVTALAPVLLAALVSLTPTTTGPVSLATPDSCVQLISTSTAQDFSNAELLLPPGGETLQQVGMGMTGCTWTSVGFQVTIGYEPIQAAQRSGLEAVLDGYNYERHPHPSGSLFSSGGYAYLITDDYHIWVDGTWWDEAAPQLGTTPLELAGQTLAILVGELAPATEAPALERPELPTTEGPLDCLEMLPAETIADIEGAGYRLDRWAEDRIDEFVSWDGTGCTWGIPQSDAMVSVAYSPIVATQVQALQDRLSAEGYAREESADGSILYRLDDSGEFTGFTAEHRYLFADDHHYYTGSGDQLIAELRSQVMESLAARAEQDVPEEAAEAPVLEVVEEPAEDVTETVTEAVNQLEAPSADPATFTGSTPSVLSGLPTVGDVDLSPRRLAATAGIAVVFAALVGLPGRLIEYAVGERIGRLEQLLAPVSRPFASRWHTVSRLLAGLPRGVQIGSGLMLATLLAGFIEPQFGFNSGSLRLFSGLLLGFVIESLLGLLLIAWALRRRGLATTVEFKAASLLVVALAVMGTRLTGFEPGIVFGLLLVLSVSTAISPREQVRLTWAELAWITVLGLASWIGYSALRPALDGTAGVSSISLFAVEVLAGVTIGCLAALPLVLLPLAGLPGATLFRASRWSWAGAFAAAMALFITIIIPLPDSWQLIEAPFATWVALFVVYAVVAVAIWVVLMFLISDTTTAGEPTGDEPPVPARDER